MPIPRQSQRALGPQMAFKQFAIVSDRSYRSGAEIGRQLQGLAKVGPDSQKPALLKPARIAAGCGRLRLQIVMAQA